jgi:hypothetical protein
MYVWFLCRYLLNDSTSIMAYGFMDINFNMESSSMVHEAGSSYFFIPQVKFVSVCICINATMWSLPFFFPLFSCLLSSLRIRR